MQNLVITSKPTADGKTRQFSAILLAYMRADMLWEGGQANTNNLRPVYLVVAGTENGLRPFLANIRAWRKAEVQSDTRRWSSRNATCMEVLKSAGYAYTWQRGDGARGGKQHLVTIYLPTLFNVNPGMIDKEMCSFISAPPAWWVKEQDAALRRELPDVCTAVLRHARRLGFADSDDAILAALPQAAHYCMYLDRRTRRPLINDLAFCLQLYYAALEDGVASTSSDKKGAFYHTWANTFECSNVERVGLAARPVVTHVSQETIDDFLVKQVQLWNEVNHGAS